MNRRTFMGSILALGAAPAIVRADILMRIVVPTTAEVMKLGGGNITAAEICNMSLRILGGHLTLGDVIYMRNPSAATGRDQFMVTRVGMNGTCDLARL